jgi:ribosomal protein S18 acetylase RimI-like enzyme
MMKLGQAETPEQIEEVRRLLREYEASLGVSLCFQGFERELAELPGEYTPPAGRLLLAFDAGQAVGCVALRRLDEETCEMKRLYLRPEFRGRGAGRRLALTIIDEARKIGCNKMRLDTLPSMREAIALYESLGFKRIEPYCHNPIPGAVFMELRL